MTDRAKSIPELTEATSYNANSYLIIETTDGTRKISSVNFNKKPTGMYEYVGGPLTPANSTITISAGAAFYDNTYLYIAVANNSLRRVALEAF